MATYFIHNTARSVHTKALRASAPTHDGLKQHIGGQHRLIRGRPVALSEEQMQLHMEELKAKHAVGLIQVRNGDGLRVDLDSLAPVARAPSIPPLPNPPMDTIQKDKPAGERRPQFAGGLSETLSPGDEHKLPELVADAPSEATDEEAHFVDGSTDSTTAQGHSNRKKGRR